MTLDSRYVTGYELEDYFVDKDTGQPLAAGTIEFWKDDNRNVPKTVYRLTGSPPNYTYTALPNPVVLSSSGTIEDNDGANVALYYFPYESDAADADIELYYVVVKNSDGVIQFTREGWPNITADSSVLSDNSAIVNELSNPQFVDVNFNASQSLLLSFTGSATEEYEIAPDWTLIVQHTGAGTVEVTRNAVSGSSQYPTNPPYTMSFVAGTNIAAMKLRQRLTHNPSIWAPATGGENGYVSTNILLAPGSAVTVQYDPSVGGAQTILSANNTTGTYTEYNNVVQLNPAANTNNANNGYVDIIINLAASGTTTLSSVQVVGVSSELQNVQYEQAPVNRQEDQLFHYYKPLLEEKPIPSYLIGWDFALNPAQILGSSIAVFATGANTSNYIWDQTILFQSANNAALTSRASDGALVLTADVASTQLALIQYVEQSVARELIANRLSVNVVGKTSQTDGIAGTVSLWYTTNASLPNMNTNASLVRTLDANGKPNSVVAGWTEVPRELGDAEFTLGTSYADFGFKGWEAPAGTQDTTTFFAIVVGFAAMSDTDPDSITIPSISLVPGDIPTRPAPQTLTQVLQDCERYYEKSYASSAVAGTATGTNALVAVQTSTTKDAGNNVNMISDTFLVPYKIEKRVAPNFTIYSPNSGSASTVYARMTFQGSNPPNSVDTTLATYWTQLYTGAKSISYYGKSGNIQSVNVGAGPSVTPASTWIEFHYVADARLGII